MIVLKCCTQYVSKLGNSAEATGMEKVSFHYNSKEGQAKECSNNWKIELTSHTKGMLKILPAGLQQFLNRELPDAQTGFGKGRGIKDQIANICWVIEKAREF